MQTDWPNPPQVTTSSPARQLTQLIKSLPFPLEPLLKLIENTLTLVREWVQDNDNVIDHQVLIAGLFVRVAFVNWISILEKEQRLGIFLLGQLWTCLTPSYDVRRPYCAPYGEYFQQCLCNILAARWLTFPHAWLDIFVESLHQTIFNCFRLTDQMPCCVFVWQIN